jgi:KDO2-lipid IV(A) lauroyltransferase
MEQSLRDRIDTFRYTAMEHLAMRWPAVLAKAIFRTYAHLSWRLVPSSREVVAANLARVIGRPADSDLVQAATREAFGLYARYWYDTFRLRATSKEELNRRFVCDGLENVDAALEKGRGAVIALPHLGNWDVAGYYLAANGYPLCAVAERLANERVFELFLRQREELGLKIVPLDLGGGAARVGPQLIELLAGNWALALVADRDLTGRGVDVEMFGATRKLPAGPALLSITSGAPLMVASIYTTDAGWHCRIQPPIQVETTGNTRADVTAITRAMAQEFERVIAAKPTDWHMFQPAWESEEAASPEQSRVVLPT